MVAYWAEFERDGINFGDMGTYENGGDLGNTMRYTMWDANPMPNAGWHMMNWYLQMQGQYIPVTKPGNGLDGVASWNPTNLTLTILFGGADGDTTVQVNGLGELGLGNTVRVRLNLSNWTTNANVSNASVACGGDPQIGGYNLYDNNFTLDGSGNLAIPVNAIEGAYNGYRLLITPPNSSTNYPTKYEAENATITDAIVYSTAQASGGRYVGGINNADSSVTFHVNVPSNGLYTVFIRYADAAACGVGTHFLNVNGQSQGVVVYPTTADWSSVKERTTSRTVSLLKGLNNITFSHATNSAELDFIDVRPGTNRYGAESASVNDANLYSFNTCFIPDCVGGINNADSSVSFNIFVPVTGAYDLSVAYGNGGAPGTYLLTNNGVGAGSVPLPATGGWLGGGWMTGNDPALVEQISTVSVNLNGGWNNLQINKGVNYGELDYINISPVSVSPAAAYAFEGNVLDSSGNGNNGTLTYASGKIGQTAQFNGVNSWVWFPFPSAPWIFQLRSGSKPLMQPARPVTNGMPITAWWTAKSPPWSMISARPSAAAISNWALAIQTLRSLAPKRLTTATGITSLPLGVQAAARCKSLLMAFSTSVPTARPAREMPWPPVFTSATATTAAIISAVHWTTRSSSTACCHPPKFPRWRSGPPRPRHPGSLPSAAMAGRSWPGCRVPALPIT